jgi:DNA-binding transcriptional ArsR family regulator
MGFAETFKALSHPIRREILELLKSERLPAGDIAGHFDVAGATISHHLNILKKAGLVIRYAFQSIRKYQKRLMAVL